MFNIRQLNLIKVVTIIFLLLFMVVSCQPSSSKHIGETNITNVVIDDDATVLSNSASIVPTQSISQIVTSTRIPSPSPTQYSTLEPSLTPLPTKTMMPTPWPTLSSNEAINMILSLLQDTQNPDCLLPCWWGAIPGQTQWQDWNPYLASFALTIDLFPEYSSFVAVFPVPVSVNYRGKLNVGYTTNTSEVITDISIASINIEGYDPQTMMILYGIPDEVWLTTRSEPREEVLPFQLIIIYQQQGISFRYYVDAERNGEFVTACFESGVVETERPDLFPTSPRIYLWEPGQTKTIEEISPIPLERYFLLETKTDLTPETLYNKFTNSNELPCIDTLAELW